MTNYKTPAEFKIQRVRECSPTEKVEVPTHATDYWQNNITNADWFSEDREQLVVLLLNTKCCILGHSLVTIGTVSETMYHPREVLRPAIMAAAHHIIVMHNHPSGDATPSEADHRMTRGLKEAAHLMQIPLLDHVIVGDAAGGRCPYFSFREAGVV